MDVYWDNLGGLDYLHSHAMISDHTYENLKVVCNFSDPACCSKSCNKLYTVATDREVGQIDPYSIYTANCLSATGNRLQQRSSSHLSTQPNNPVRQTIHIMIQFTPTSYNFNAATVTMICFWRLIQ